MSLEAVEPGVTQLRGVGEAVRPLALPAEQQKKELPEPAPKPTPRADRVEISDASRALAALLEQADDSPELQLPVDKLRRMTEG